MDGDRERVRPAALSVQPDMTGPGSRDEHCHQVVPAIAGKPIRCCLPASCRSRWSGLASHSSAPPWPVLALIPRFRTPAHCSVLPRPCDFPGLLHRVCEWLSAAPRSLWRRHTEPDPIRSRQLARCCSASRTLVWDADFVRLCLRAADEIGVESPAASALSACAYADKPSVIISQDLPVIPPVEARV